MFILTALLSWTSALLFIYFFHVLYMHIIIMLYYYHYYISLFFMQCLKCWIFWNVEIVELTLWVVDSWLMAVAGDVYNYLFLHFVRKLILRKFSLFFLMPCKQRTHTNLLYLNLRWFIQSWTIPSSNNYNKETKVNEKAYESILNYMANNALWCWETFIFFRPHTKDTHTHIQNMYANCALWAKVFFFDPFLLLKQTNLKIYVMTKVAADWHK